MTENLNSFFIAAITICLAVMVVLTITKFEDFLERRRERKRRRKWM